MKTLYKTVYTCKYTMLHTMSCNSTNILHLPREVMRLILLQVENANDMRCVFLSCREFHDTCADLLLCIEWMRRNGNIEHLYFGGFANIYDNMDPASRQSLLREMLADKLDTLFSELQAIDFSTHVTPHLPELHVKMASDEDLFVVVEKPFFRWYEENPGGDAWKFPWIMRYQLEVRVDILSMTVFNSLSAYKFLGEMGIYKHKDYEVLDWLLVTYNEPHPQHNDYEVADPNRMLIFAMMSAPTEVLEFCLERGANFEEVSDFLFEDCSGSIDITANAFEFFHARGQLRRDILGRINPLSRDAFHVAYELGYPVSPSAIRTAKTIASPLYPTLIIRYASKLLECEVDLVTTKIDMYEVMDLTSFIQVRGGFLDPDVFLREL